MANVFVYWGLSAVVLVVAAAMIGRHAHKGGVLGILVDERGRFSLSQFQVVLWTILVLSLLSGVFFARLLGSVPNPLNVAIPSELLIVMGISVGSAATAGAVKAGKDLRNVTIKDKDSPHFAQLFLTEEGAGPIVVDVSRFQNFFLTLIAVTAYVTMVVGTLSGTKALETLQALPGFDGTLLTLLGISHAGYLAGKLPDKK